MIGSAGFKHFSETLTGFQYPVFVKVADSRMQGHRTESNVLSAIDTLEASDVDLIVVLRGGGSKLDLSDLDNEKIARKIAMCKLRVWTAIGHETDESVLDFVSHSKFKTPTAVAEEILNRLNSLAANHLDALNVLRTTWDRRLLQENNKCRNGKTIFIQKTENRIAKSLSEIESRRNQIRLSVSNRVSVTERRRLSKHSNDFRRRVEQRLITERQRTKSGKDSLKTKVGARFKEKGMMLVSSRAWFSPERFDGR